MKKLAFMTFAVGLFAITGCNNVKCYNCDCTWNMTETTTTTTDFGNGTTDTDIATNTDSGSNSINSVCDNDEVNLDGSHLIDAGNVDGTHTYTDENFFNQNLGGGVTINGNTITSMTYTCSCSDA